MSFYYACLSNSLLSAILGVFVYIKGKKNLTNVIWGFFCLCVALWSLGLGMMAYSPNEKIALFWLKYVHYLGAIFIPIVFLHFCLVLIGIYQKRKKLILTGYSIIIILLVANFSGYLASVKKLKPFNYYTKPGPLYLFFTVVFFIFVIYSLFEIFRAWKHLSGYKKHQLKYFFIALSIGFFGGSTAFFPVFNLPLFPYGIYFAFIYTLIVSYAIVRYHFMNINIIMKHGTIHTIMITFTTVAYISIIFIFENILNYFFNYNTIISRIFAGTIIALTFLPVHNKVKSIIDKLLFRKRGEYLQSIKDFSQSLITILDLSRLMDTIAENIRLIINAKHSALFIFDEKEKAYIVKSLSGNKENEILFREMFISKDSPIICWLQNNKNIEIKSKLIKEDNNNLFSPVINQMEELNAELIIPLFFDKKLIGFLILGEKKNQDIYNPEEINLLKSMANQTATAYINASSYNKLKKLYIGTIESFIKAIEAKDEYYQGHSYRVVNLAIKIGLEYGLSRENIELLKYSSVLHDIGNIKLPDNIITKKNKLTKKEFDEIKKHPINGKDIISSIEYFEDAGNIILHHHEQWDGKGYPYNLKGEEIPLLSRIIFVAEVFDGLTSERSYRPPLSIDAAVKEIKKEIGKKFDPKIVDCFLSSYNNNFIE